MFVYSFPVLERDPNGSCRPVNATPVWSWCTTTITVLLTSAEWGHYRKRGITLCAVQTLPGKKHYYAELCIS